MLRRPPLDLDYNVRMVHDSEKVELQDATHASDCSDSVPQAPENTKEIPRQINRDSCSNHTHSSGGTIAPIPVEGDGESPPKSKSSASSTRSRPLSIVPRSQRRGLLGRLSIIPEVDRPHEYKNKTKWLLTAITACSAAAAPLGSAIFFRKFEC